MTPSHMADKQRTGRSDITERLLREFIFAFYEKVKKDPTLGPVFMNIIGDTWDSHIETICLFWITVTRLGTGYRARNFMPAHTRHPSIRAEQLPRWLELFRATAREKCSSETAAVLVEIAERMADNIAFSLDARDGTNSVASHRR
jgi:hemoglobin